MRCLSLILVLVSSIAFSQISLTDLKRAGVNSEEDLKKLGVSSEEINALKEEYKQNQGDTPQKEIQEESAQPAKSEIEKEIQLKSTKDTTVLESVFGQSLFRSGSVAIQGNNDRIIPSSNYILGSGDRISVTIWGSSQFSGEFKLDEYGNITPNLVGRINLKGKRFGQAEKIIRKRFGEVYRFNSSQIAVNISYSKVISVNIVGEVLSPGTYSVPSVNSAFNILTLSNGINKNGSVRNIAVVRDGKVMNNLDVYKFMNKPQKGSFIYLNEGDFIMVPTIGNVVSVNGAVNKPGKYELKEGESLFQLLEFAGGLHPIANINSISILRTSKQGKIVKTFSYENSKAVILEKGDQVIINENSQNISNKITIKGEVFSPGIQEFKEGENLDILLKRANGLTPNAYLRTAHIYRTMENLDKEVIKFSLKNRNELSEIAIQDLDEVVIFSKKSFLDSNFVRINGFVRNPDRVHYKSNMTLSDIITISGGTYPQADLGRIEIERVDFNSSYKDTSGYIRVLTKNLISDSEFQLQPFDIVNVRGLPEFKFQEAIEVVGQVKYPGIYSLNGNKVKTSDAIARAGGLTELAYGQKAYIERSEDSLGIILLNLELVLNKKKSPFNYSLRPGDKIFVPRVNDIVSISGAIGSQFINKDDKINVPFQKGKRASHYIKKYAGGYAKRANRKKVYAITLNGQVKRSRYLGIVKPKVEKGDQIMVKYKPEKKNRERNKNVDWNDQIENFTIKLTGVITLLVLMQNAFN